MTGSFEQEVKQFFEQNEIKYEEFTGSQKEPDFSFLAPLSGRLFWLEVKEKRQPVNLASWPRTQVPERDLFILDDLTARKLLQYSPDCGLLVRDGPGSRYVFYSIVHLLEMPKVRTNRKLETNGGYKGKWLIDLRHGEARPSLVRAFLQVDHYLSKQESIFSSSPAWGTFTGETLGTGGIPRTRQHFEGDWRDTR